MEFIRIEERPDLKEVIEIFAAKGRECQFDESHIQYFEMVLIVNIFCRINIVASSFDIKSMLYGQSQAKNKDVPIERYYKALNTIFLNTVVHALQTEYIEDDAVLANLKREDCLFKDIIDYYEYKLK